MEQQNLLKTGTTTVGILCKDAVVLAADMRATAGNFIANRDVDKVVAVNNRMAVTTAGTVSDIQLLVKLLRSEIKIKELRTNRNITVKEAASLLGSFNYGNIRKYSTIPGVAHFIFAGVDNKGASLYDVFVDGSVFEVKNPGFVATGSGSSYAYGLLEDNYKENIESKDAVELAIRAIKVALKRDSASGNGINVFVIDKNGARKVSTKVASEKLE